METTVKELNELINEEIEELTSLIDSAAVSISRYRNDVGSIEASKLTLMNRISALENEQSAYLSRRSSLLESKNLIEGKIPTPPEPDELPEELPEGITPELPPVGPEDAPEPEEE